MTIAGKRHVAISGAVVDAHGDRVTFGPIDEATVQLGQPVCPIPLSNG